MSAFEPLEIKGVRLTRATRHEVQGVFRAAAGPDDSLTGSFSGPISPEVVALLLERECPTGPQDCTERLRRRAEAQVAADAAFLLGIVP